MKRRSQLLIFFLLFALLIPACQRSRGDNAEKKLKLASLPINNFDPLYSNDRASQKIIGHLYQTLYNYDYLRRPYKLQADLAKKLPELSDNNLTALIEIKPHNYFIDDPCFKGRRSEVKAADVVYSLKRLLKKKNNSANAWILSEKVKKIEVVGEYQLRLQFKRPIADLAHLLAMPATAIVPRQAIIMYGKEFARHPVGSGPYALKDFKAGVGLSLKANTNYQRVMSPENKKRKLPLLGEIEIKFFKEELPLWWQFMSGELDLAIVGEGVLAKISDKRQRLKKEYRQQGLNLSIANAEELTYLIFNFRDKAIAKDLKLRRAIAKAIDRQRAIKMFFAGLARPTADFIPGKEEEIVKADRQAAKRLLAGRDKLRLNYDLIASRKNRLLAEFFSRQLAELNIVLNSSSNNYQSFMQKINRGDFQLTTISWFADYPSPSNFLQLFYSKNSSPGPNLGAYANAQFDKLFLRLAAENNLSRRNELVQKMLQILQKELPAIPLWQRKVAIVWHGWLRGYKYNDFSNGYFAFLDIDLSKKANLKRLLKRR